MIESNRLTSTKLPLLYKNKQQKPEEKKKDIKKKDIWPSD